MIFDPFGDDFFKRIMDDMLGVSRPKIGDRHTAPLTETIIIGKELFVIVELPGADEGSIKINLSGNLLQIDAKANFYYSSQPKEYSKRIQLPVRVDKKFSKTFHNGILELRFKIKGWLPRRDYMQEEASEDSDIIPIR